MPDTEAPLTPVERLMLASLYARLTVSQNRTLTRGPVSESACYADLNIRGPETLSHKEIPAIRLSEGSGTC